MLEDFEDLQSLREAKSEDYNKPAIPLSRLITEVD